MRVFGFIFALALAPIVDAEESRYTIEHGIEIPLNDGVKLSAAVYRPDDGQARHPLIFTLTPYIADSYHDRPAFFARRGYAFALVDARGRGNSGGTFDPLQQERNDAAQVVEYFAKQRYTTGEITLWGGSYAGYNQWLAAAKQPKGLFTIVPVASPYAGVDFPMIYNVSYPYVMRWLTFTRGNSGQANLFGDERYWRETALPLYRGERPFVDLDELAGVNDTRFDEWIKHPQQGPYWDAFNPTDAELAAIDLPILSITGAYDGDQPGAIQFYREHLRLANPAARNKHYLIIGPWDHAGTRTPRAEFGGAKFGEASLLDLNQLHLDWYEYARGKRALPEFLSAPVRYYVAGREEWASAPSLDSITGSRETLYLSSPDRAADRAFAAGDLSATAVEQVPDQYRYDPLDFRRADIEKDDPNGELISQRTALAIDGDGLVYMSAPLEKSRTFAGFPSVQLTASTDVPDTDIGVTLSMVDADGLSLLLSSQVLRLRYRESLREPKRYTPNDVVTLTFDRMTFMARELKPGSRLRLVVSAPNSPGLQKNFNSGGIVADETAKDARVATVKLYLDPKQPSALSLPVAAP
jgi:uncharacterized protein